MDDKKFIEIVSTSNSMAEAAAKIGVHFNTFKKRALRLGCYNPNPGLKGSKKSWVSDRAISLEEILKGKHPQYQTFKLKHRLYREGKKLNKCESCGIDSWKGQPIECELDHVNGDSSDHRLENLRILCPNCHSQTETFRAKNITRVYSNR